MTTRARAAGVFAIWALLAWSAWVGGASHRAAVAEEPPPARPVIPPEVTPRPESVEDTDEATMRLVARLRAFAASLSDSEGEFLAAVEALEHRAGRVRAAAAAVLRSHEDVAVRYVRARLSHSEAAARRAALLVVQALGPAGQAFVLETIELVSDPEMGVCNAASSALERIGPLDDAVALRIVRELPRRSPRWRARALELLVSAESATPGERPWVGEAFAWLVATSPAPDELPGRFALLGWAARSPTWDERADAHLVGMLRAKDAATWIGVLGALEATKRPLAASHVPSVVALLRDPVTHERAIDVLRRRVAGPILASNLAASDDPAVRTGLLLALEPSALDLPDVRRVVAALHDAPSRVGVLALGLTLRHGPRDRDATTRLAGRLGGPWSDGLVERTEVMFLCGRCDPTVGRVRTAIRAGLRDRETFVRLAVVDGLADARQPIDAEMAAWLDERSGDFAEIATTAASAAIALARATPERVGVLRTALASSDLHLRRIALRAIQRAGPAARELLPDLEARARDAAPPEEREIEAVIDAVRASGHR